MTEFAAENKKYRGGFTLVEVIVVSLLAAILVLGAGGLFAMYLNSARESAAMLRMHRQGDALTEEIARMARSANVIMPGIMPNFGNAQSFEEYLEIIGNADLSPAPVNAQGARFISHNADAGEVIIIGAVRFRNGVVQICKNDPCEYNGDWNDFSIDGHPVLIDESETNAFIFSQSRTEVAMSITIKTQIANREYFMQIERWAFKCRIPDKS